MLRVKAIPNEATRFYVESAEVICTNCGKLYPKTPNGHARFSHEQTATLRACGVWTKVSNYLKQLSRQFNPRNVPGGQCRKCGGALDERWHLVDVSSMDYAGQCACEFWSIVIRKELEKLPKAQRMCHENTCAHIPEAQRFAFQLSLRLHEQERLANGRGRKEEDAP